MYIPSFQVDRPNAVSGLVLYKCLVPQNNRIGLLDVNAALSRLTVFIL